MNISFSPAKMMMGEYTDVNPGGPVAFSPPPPPPTTPNLHHQSKHQDQVDTQDVDQKADDSGTDKEDIQTLFNNLANVIAECAEQKERIDVSTFIKPCDHIVDNFVSQNNFSTGLLILF